MLVLFTLLWTLLLTAGAVAEPISLAIVGAIGLSGTAATIGAAVVSTAITLAASYALTLVATALRSNTDPVAPDVTAAGASGNDLNTKYGGDVPRSAIFGLGVTAGHLVYANVFGPNNTGLQAVFVLGDGQHDGISRMWYNGKEVTFSATPTHGTQVNVNEFIDSGGVPQVKVTFYDGRFGQTADPDLVANANPAGRWTTDHKGKGVSYLVIYQGYLEELETTNMPSILVEMRGLKLYDPRLDTTVGGSGPHRWGTPTTYEWTDNPAIIEYNYRRGVYIDDQLILGMGVAPADLVLSMYMSAANVCDEAVAILPSGTEKRYRCGFTASSDRSHSEVITTIRDSMVGYSLERVGQFAPIPGVNQVSLFSFTDDDLEVGKPFSYSKYKTRSTVATAVYGSFSDPEQMWGTVPFPARIDPADDALMGERLSRNVDLTQIFSPSQAQRVAEIERRRSMMQVNGTCTLPARFFGVQPGDWGTYNSARYGSTTIVVKGVTLNQDHSITITWDAIAASVYSWTTAGEEDRPAIPTGGLPGTRVNIVTGFTAEGNVVEGDDGVKHPGIEVLWDSIQDPTVEAVIIEFRVNAGPGPWEVFRASNPSTGIGQITGGIQEATLYDLRASLITNPHRVTGVTSIITVLSGDEHVIGGVLAAGIVGQLVETQIANAAITAAKLHDQAVELTKFAAGIQPVSIVSSLPTPAGYTGPNIVFLTTDKKMYRYNSTVPSWVASVPTTDLTGQVVQAQIADAAISTAKFAAGIEPVSIVSSNPTPSGYTGPKTIFNTTDKKMYRYDASVPAWTAVVPSTDITGQLTDAQLAAIAAAKITGTLTDSQLAAISASKVTGTLTDAQIAGLSAAKITGQITTTQITDDAVTTPKIFAGSVTTAKIFAGAITTEKLAIGTGANKIMNSDGLAGLSGWTLQSNTTGLTVNVIQDQVNFPYFYPVQLTLSGTPAASTFTDIYFTNVDVGTAGIKYVPVTAGQTYEFSVYAAAASGTVQTVLVWADHNGSAIGSALFGSVAAAGGGGFGVEGWTRSTLVGAVAPAGAVGAVLIARTTWTGAGSPSCYLALPFFGVGRPNQTQASDWSPAGASIISGSGIVTRTIQATKIVANAITAGEIAASTITATQIAANTITAAKIAAGTITAAEIAASTITASQIAAGTITATQIASATITASQIASDTITAGQIAAGAISTSELAAGAVTATNIAASTITTNEIAANTILGGDIAASTITGGNIAANTITAGNIAADTITAGQIAAGAISTSELAAGAVTAGIIAAGAVTTSKLAVGTAQNKCHNSDAINGPIGYWLSNAIVLSGSSVTTVNNYTQVTGGLSVGYTQLVFVGSQVGGNLALVVGMPNANDGLVHNDYTSRFGVVGNQTYEFSYYTSFPSTWAQLNAVIVFFDGTGAVTGSVTGPTVTTASGGSFENWARPYVIGVAPAGSVSAYAYMLYTPVVTIPAGNALYFAMPYFAAANVNQTEPSPWSPAGATVISGDQIVTNGITARHILAGEIVAGKIAAGAINATTIIADNIIIREKMVVDTATRMDVTGPSGSAINWDTAAYLMGTLPITTFGGKIYVNCTVSGRTGAGGGAASLFDCYLILHYDDVQVFYVYAPGQLTQVNVTSGSHTVNMTGSFVLSWSSATAAGDHTLKLYMASVQNAGVGPAGFDTTIACIQGRR